MHAFLSKAPAAALSLSLLICHLGFEPLLESCSLTCRLSVSSVPLLFTTAVTYGMTQGPGRGDTTCSDFDQGGDKEQMFSGSISKTEPHTFTPTLGWLLALIASVGFDVSRDSSASLLDGANANYAVIL